MTPSGEDLTGTVAVVTGAASGIGAAISRRLARRGARLAVVDIDGDGAQRLADEVGGIALVADVSDPEAVGVVITETERRLGRLDVVALNAGLVGRQTGLDTELDLADYRRLLGVNVDHVVFGTSAAVPALRRAGGGTIVATASLAGLVPIPGDPLYTLTKHAVVGYVRAAGAALADEGILLAAICPGFADTPLIAASRDLFGDFPLLTADDVADAFEAVLAGGEAGQAWLVQPGNPAVPYRFRGVPGPPGGQRPPELRAGGY